MLPSKLRDAEWPDDDTARHIVLHGVSWEAYVTAREALELPGLKMMYDDGTLEIMRPSRKHENDKTLFARLLELYALERDIDLYGYGSMTFKRQARAKGLEPDECYTVGHEMGETPDLAIEVVVTHLAIDRPKVYAALGVPELWLWRKNLLEVYVLRGEAYVHATRSKAFPGLDLEVLATHARNPSQPAALRAFRAWLLGSRRARRRPASR